MKRIMAALVAVLLIAALAVPGFAAEDEDEDEGGGGWFDLSFLTDWLTDWFAPTEVEQNAFNKFLDWFFHIPDKIFDGIEDFFLLSSDDNYSYLNPGRMIQILADIFLPLGYMTFLICWAIGLGNKAITLELYEGKDFIRIGVSLIGGILLLSISTEVLRLIAAIAQNIAVDILSTETLALYDILPDLSIENYKSSVPIIGIIIQMVNFLSDSMPFMLYFSLATVCAAIMNISLGIRIIKMAIYQGVAPVFFGLSAAESTKQYFRNFMVQYIAICFQLVAMAILFSFFEVAMLSMIADQIANPLSGSFVSGGIMMIVFTVMMLKSDKLFERVFR